MSTWRWVLILFLGIGLAILTGCGGDDDSNDGPPAAGESTGDEPAAADDTDEAADDASSGGAITTNGTTSGGADSGGSTSSGSTSGGGTSAGGTSGTSTPPAITEEVLFNNDFALEHNETYQRAIVPLGAGRINVTVSWTAVDQLDQSPITISLYVALNGSAVGNQDSPYSTSVDLATGVPFAAFLRNPNPGTRASGTIKAVWYAN
jgi:hypothetical protein